MAVIGRHGWSERAKGVVNSAAFRRLSPAGLSTGAAPRIAEAVLVILFGFFLARIALSIFAPLPLPAGQAVAAAPQTGGPAVSAMSVKSPFPTTVLETQAVETAPVVAETTLDLTLTGVWAGEDGGSATIRTPDGKQSRFAVGDVIVPGVRLEAVYADQVTIEREGMRESLRFESKAPPPARALTASPSSRASGAAARPPASVAAASLGALSSILRVAPSIDRDGNMAVEVYATRNRDAFTALGLRDGDRLVSIDGAPTPTEPATLSAVLAQIQRNGMTNIVVERNGERVPLELSLDDLGID